MADSTISRWSKLETDPLRSFRFLATFTPSDGRGVVGGIDTKFSGGFTNISGLSINTQSIGYREGGYNTTLHQIPGMTTFSPITLQRGTIAGHDEAITWMKGLFSAAAGDGAPQVAKDNSFRMNVQIDVLDHPITAAPLITAGDKVDVDKAVKMTFMVHNAWITSLSFSDLNAGDNQILFETMQLVHEGLSVTLK